MRKYGKDIRCGCVVHINPNRGSYNAGDEICGTVVLTVDKQTLFWG